MLSDCSYNNYKPYWISYLRGFPTHKGALNRALLTPKTCYLHTFGSRLPRLK
jgi:hypothetical protein